MAYKPKTKDAVNPFAKIESNKVAAPESKPKVTGYKKPAPAPKSTMDSIIGGMQGIGDYLRGINSKKK